jgi:hypothetical protein
LIRRNGEFVVGGSWFDYAHHRLFVEKKWVPDNDPTSPKSAMQGKQDKFFKLTGIVGLGIVGSGNYHILRKSLGRGYSCFILNIQ